MNINIIGYSAFTTIFQAKLMNIMILCFLLTELVIFLFQFKNTKRKSKENDRGSVWILIIGISVILELDGYYRQVFNWKYCLYDIFYWIGIFLVILGIIIRIWSVITLGKYFTISVKIDNNQKLIEKGLYKYIRHPCYTGNIASLLGIAFGMRNIFGILTTIVLLTLIYGYRIYIEEKALKLKFKESYIEYKNRTKFVIPYLL